MGRPRSMPFQSTSLCGKQRQFQSTSPCGEQRGEFLKYKDIWYDFNPHPRVGSNRCRTRSCRCRDNFNPHPRVGSNTKDPVKDRVAVAISIHIPVWGATRALSRTPSTWADFNPHPRVGSNKGVVSYTIDLGGFQSTSPCGEQHLQALRKEERTCIFQSTSPCGEQPVGYARPYGVHISIHIPVWGATAVSRVL